jgi:hypothetical protein
MAPRKQIYKITYPNGKIYVGMDLIGMLLNVGSPSARERIAADLDAHRLDLTLHKEILWESETATDDEVRAMEIKLIRETGAKAIKLVRHERSNESVRARRKRRRIKEIGAEIRDIDRMMHALGSRLGAQHHQRSN